MIESELVKRKKITLKVFAQVTKLMANTAMDDADDVVAVLARVCRNLDAGPLRQQMLGLGRSPTMRIMSSESVSS